MKKILFVLLLLAVARANAQDNGCGAHWVGMRQALGSSEGTVMYDVQYTNKVDCNRYIALEHTFPFKVGITIYLRGTDWDGKVNTSMFATLNDIAPNTRYVGTGNWHTFKQVNEVVRVEVTYNKGNDRYQIIYDRDKGINGTFINGKTVANYNAEQAQKQQQQNSRANNSNSGYGSNNNSVSTNNNNVLPNNNINSNRPLNFGTRQVSNNNNNSNMNAAITNYNIAMTKLNNQLQTSQNIYNAFMGGLQQLQQIHDEKVQREQQEEAQREQEEQQRQAQLAEQQREEAQRQAEAAAAARAEMNRQWNIDRQTIGGYMVSLKTAEIPGNIKTVYYITYERNYQTGKLFVRTYTLNKYSDGTWMFQNDLQNKIKFTPYFNSSGMGRLLGFFTSKAKAQAALKQIKNNAPQANIDNSFLALNSNTPATTNNSDFWNQ